MDVECNLIHQNRYTFSKKSDNKWLRKIIIVAEKNLLENVGKYMI